MNVSEAITILDMVLDPNEHEKNVIIRTPDMAEAWGVLMKSYTFHKDRVCDEDLVAKTKAAVAECAAWREKYEGLRDQKAEDFLKLWREEAARG